MKTAMIWGAHGAIARALAKQLMAAGWRVIGFSRHPEAIEAEVSYSFAADVAHDFQVQNGVMSAGYEVDEVHLWVYAAGDITAAATHEMTPEMWRRILDANLNGAYLALHRSMPLLAEDAHIVFIGAISERLRLPRLSAYAAAKAGLEAFAETVRKEERRKRVLLVRPAAVDTPFWEKASLRKPKDAAAPQKVAEKIIEAVSNGRSGQLDLA